MKCEMQNFVKMVKAKSDVGPKPKHKKLWKKERDEHRRVKHLQDVRSILMGNPFR
jgi:hypothetical protein